MPPPGACSASSLSCRTAKASLRWACGRPIMRWASGRPRRCQLQVLLSCGRSASTSEANESETPSQSLKAMTPDEISSFSWEAGLVDHASGDVLPQPSSTKMGLPRTL